MSQYKAIIFDLDGTAVPNRMETMPSRRMIDTVARYKHQIHLCAATGRPRSNGLPILTALDLIEPCAIAAGTQIYNPATGEFLNQELLAEADMARVLEICRHLPTEILLREEQLGEGHPARLLQPAGDVNVMYIMHISQSDLDRIRPSLEAIPDIAVSSLISWTGEGIDVHITPRTATKEHAVAEIIALLGITKAETIGVGDADNDLHLFKGVGLKVAMGNASPQLKAAADIIAPSVDDDGLADIIERYAAAS